MPFEQEVADLFEDLQRYNAHKHRPQRPSPPSSDDGHDTVQPTSQEPMDFDQDPPVAVDDGPFVEEYERSAKEYGSGVTFMSGFGRDQLSNPLMKGHLRFLPLRIFDSAARAMRIYSE
jgi:hypothetical protein